MAHFDRRLLPTFRDREILGHIIFSNSSPATQRHLRKERNDLIAIQNFSYHLIISFTDCVSFTYGLASLFDVSAGIGVFAMSYDSHSHYWYLTLRYTSIIRRQILCKRLGKLVALSHRQKCPTSFLRVWQMQRFKVQSFSVKLPLVSGKLYWRITALLYAKAGAVPLPTK